MSSTGFEALPPRVDGRAAKRRRQEPAVVSACASAGALEAAADAAADAAAAAAPPPAHAAGACAGGGYEYLDHTADVQIHAWAPSAGEAYAQAALGMYGYMTPADGVRREPAAARVLAARGRDAVTLLYNFMDACLYAFASDDFVARDMAVLAFRAGPPGHAYLRVAAYGERFQLGHHVQGTEVKAITYSNMQIITPEGTLTANDAGEVAVAGKGELPPPPLPKKSPPLPGADDSRRAPYELYVIVDI